MWLMPKTKGNFFNLVSVFAKLFFFSFLIFLIFAQPSFLQAQDSKNSDPFKIDKRIILAGTGSLNILRELNSVLPSIQAECSDEVDETTKEVISKGYFKHQIDKNEVYLEADKETGYSLGNGSVTISYSKKCPASLVAKAFKDVGVVKADFSFKAPKKIDGNKVRGSYEVKLKIPTKISFSKTVRGQWQGEITDNKVIGEVKLSVGVAGIGFDASIPFSANLAPTSTPTLIEFGLIQDKPELSILAPYSVELLADGEDKQEFTTKAEGKVQLINKKNDDLIDEIISGAPNISIKIKMDKFWITGLYLKPAWGLLNGANNKQLELITDEKGEAKFTYTTPEITDKHYEEAEITLRSQSSKTKSRNGPPAYIKLKKALGKIKGELVDFTGKKLSHEMKLTLRYPGNAPVKEKVVKVTLKKGQSKFEIPTTYVSKDYQLRIEPPDHLSDMIVPKEYNLLNYDVDLGVIVIGDVEQFEKATLNHVREFLKKAGLLSLAEDKLSLLRFTYDTEESYGPYYTHNDNKVHLPNKDVWLTPNSNDILEKTYHEIFHAVHADIAFDDPGWSVEIVEYLSKSLTGRGDRGKHKMWEENENKLGLDKTELAFNESISNFMAHLMMEELGMGFDKMKNSDSGLSGSTSRENFYLDGSMTDRNRDKVGEIVEGKIVGFLIDYYNDKNYSPAQKMQDFFITTRDFAGYSGFDNARDIQEWIVSKTIAAGREGDKAELKRLEFLMEKYNITPDENHTLHKIDLFSGQLNDNLSDALNQQGGDKAGELKDQQKALSTALDKAQTALANGDTKEANKQREKAQRASQAINNIVDKTNLTTPPDKSATHTIGDSSYKVGGGASYTINASGTMNVDSGQVTVDVAKGDVGAIETSDAQVRTRGTVYSVEKMGDKTIVKVAQGKVEILNRKSREIYLAREGEEIEVKGDKIILVRTFDPASAPEFKKSWQDYLSLRGVRSLVVPAGLGLVVIVLLTFFAKKFKKIKKK